MNLFAEPQCFENGSLFAQGSPDLWPGFHAPPERACLASPAATPSDDFPQPPWSLLDGSLAGWLIFGPIDAVEPMLEDFCSLALKGARSASLGFPQALGGRAVAAALWRQGADALMLVHANADAPRMRGHCVGVRFGPNVGSLHGAMAFLTEAALCVAGKSKPRARQGLAALGHPEGFAGNARRAQGRGLVVFGGAIVGMHQAALLVRLGASFFLDARPDLPELRPHFFEDLDHARRQLPHWA